MRIFLFFMFFCSHTAYAELTDKHPMSSNGAINVEHYKIYVDASQADFISKTCNDIELNIVAELKIESLAKQQNLHLHFNPQASGEMTVTDAATGQKYNHNINQTSKQGYYFISVNMGRELSEGEIVSLKFKYKYYFGKLKDLPFGGFYQDAIVCDSTGFFLNSYAYSFRSFVPSNDVLNDSATNEFIIETPENEIAAANGKLVSGNYHDGIFSSDKHTRTFHWLQTQPVSTSVTSFVLRARENQPIEMPSFRGIIPVISWASQDRPLPNGFQWVYNEAKLIEEFIGPFPFDKIGLMGAGWDGGMEYANLMIGDFGHELIHQWWGNTVRPKNFGEAWISEGFTSFYSNISYIIDNNLDGNSFDVFFPECTPEKPCEKLDGPFDQLRLIYTDGARCLNKLRNIILNQTKESKSVVSPSEAFFSFLRQYYRAHVFQAVSSKEFVSYVRTNLESHLIQHGAAVDHQTLVNDLDGWQKTFFTF